MVTITPAAVTALNGLLAKEDDAASGLRLEVTPGGCSGFEYAMTLASAKDGDEVIEHDGARLIIDRFSVPYLLGAEVDYEESFQGAGFVVKNPNATASCGCGKSFQT
ncbi:MAG: iron-sulfur cluster assembly accessory protein [Thermoleophilia bacterium]|nr:iron-sulfur cluster assembly accessory protein [Thermoleophilia bacterium]